MKHMPHDWPASHEASGIAGGGAGGGETGGERWWPQIVQPPLLTEPSERQVIVSPVARTISAGPDVPLKVAPLMVR